MAKREQTVTSIAARGSNRAARINSMLDVALNCIARGWYVFPCKPRDKEPLNKGAYKHATLDEARVRDWWARTPEANVGIAPGVSKLTVLDVDTGLADEQALHLFVSHYNLPITFAVRTGKRPDFRVQLYFASPEPLMSFNGWEVDTYAGDVRGTWGHVMAPGCIHPESGARYEVLWDQDIVPVPDWARTLKPIKTERAQADPTAPIVEWRNDTLIRILGKHRAAGADDDAIEYFAHHINETRMKDNPLDEEELNHIIHNACRWPIGEPPVEITLGGSKTAQPEAAKLPERMRPVYPIAAWEGTVVAEFAKLCADDNNIPRKMYAEAFRCALGAVVGDRISCPSVEGALPRSYTVIVAPKGKGKGTAIRRAVKFFSQPWYGTRSTGGVTIQGDASGLLSGSRDFIWKPKGIGAWVAAASSVPGMARLTKDQDSTLKNKPHLTWGSTLPRILSVHEEMKTFLSTLFIEGGVGSGMEGVICQLWDDVSFHGTATGTRDAAYGEMMFSLLAGVTEQDWFDLLSRGNAVGSGLMSRFNLIGTEGQFENVSRMRPPNLATLQETFLSRVVQLEDAHARVSPTEAAYTIINEWAETLPEGSERMNVHAWRSALLLAWLRHEESITAKTAEDAVRLGQYQIASHDYYRTKSADNAVAKVQARIVRALELKGPMGKRQLQQRTNAHRDGTELWNRALAGLQHDERVGKREDGKLYLAAE